MLYQIGIKNGFAQVKGAGRHIKIISAETPVRLQAMDSDGRVLLDSKLRAPMATELPAPAATVNLYADDQVIELWYSLQPLEYLQLTAAGASRARASSKKIFPGVAKIVDANQRQSVTLLSDTDLNIGGADVAGDGWPLKAGIKENFTLAGEIYAFYPLPEFDYSGITGAFANVATGSGYATVPEFGFALANYLVFGRYAEPVYTIDKTGGAAQVLESGEVYAAVKDGHSIYLVVKNGSIYRIKKTTDGQNLQTVADLTSKLGVLGAQLIVQNNQTNRKRLDCLVGDWLTTPASFGSVRCFVAINIKTGEVKRSPDNIGVSAQLSAIYHPDTGVFYLAVHGVLTVNPAAGIYVSQGNQWVKVYENALDLRGFVANEQGKVMVMEPGFIKRFDVQNFSLTTLFTPPTNRVIQSYLSESGYLFYDFFYYELWAVDEAFVPVQVNNTGPNGSAKIMIYDAQEGALYSIRKGNGIIFDKLPVAGLPEFSAVNVKALEYLI